MEEEIMDIIMEIDIIKIIINSMDILVASKKALIIMEIIDMRKITKKEI